MKALLWPGLVACLSLCVAVEAGAQTPVGALAIDERQGDQYGWAVDYETAAAAQERALQECGSGCSVVLTFGRCAAYAADQDAASTAVGWAESFDSAAGARQAALSECSSRGGGSGCTVRVWGCNGPVVEEGLNLGRAARRQIQLSLSAEGFDPGAADGLFGPRTRAAIRSWQSARGVRSTGYLDGPQVEALRSRSGAQQQPPVSAGVAATDSGGLEVVFWQSIQNSTNPLEFEAYLEQFPNGVFRVLAQARLAALRGSTGGATTTAAQGVGGALTSASETRTSGAPSTSRTTPTAGARRPSGVAIRPSQTCAGKPTGAACWLEISEQPGCHLWNVRLEQGETATWTGECTGGFAQGTGTITWVWDGNRQTGTGRIVDGKLNGNWVIRGLNGYFAEGPFVGGEFNGHWIVRQAGGTVTEGPYVNGERHGNYIIRWSDGSVEEGLYVNGARTGNWVIRFSNGNIADRLFVNDDMVSERVR